jgi:hypothetical protein
VAKIKNIFFLSSYFFVYKISLFLKQKLNLFFMKKLLFITLFFTLFFACTKAVGQFSGEYGTENVSILLDPPTITTDSLPNGAVGAAYTHPLTATGATPIVWELENGNLPPGLTLSESGVIFGYPTTEGTFNFTVIAQNIAGYDTKSLSIKIFPSIYIITDTLPNGTVGVDYEQVLVAFGTPLITWSLENGNLPQGLTLSTNGVISGVPTAEGTFNFMLKAQNSEGFDTKELSIIVINPQDIKEKEATKIMVYPNPTTGKLQVTSYKLQVTGIEVLDIMGKIVSFHHLITSSSDHQIDISSLNSGIYFIKIATEQGAIVKKAIKQ